MSWTLPLSNRGSGYFIMYKTPTGLVGVQKLASDALVDARASDQKGYLDEMTKKWRGRRKGYRVIDRYFSTGGEPAIGKLWNPGVNKRTSRPRTRTKRRTSRRR